MLLAEFASESENEGALEIVRVQSLSMVGASYAPLIYGLKQDANYKVLIEQVESVKKNLEKNPTLPEKIVSITAYDFNFILFDCRN
jgi:putative heme iron utilization protein